MDNQKSHGECLSVGESPVSGISLKYILRRHKRWIGRIAWSPDGYLLASPSYDDTIRIWNIAQTKCIATLKEHNSTVHCVSWSPNGDYLASCSYDKSIRIWDTKTWKTIKVLGKNNSTANSVIWSPDGEKIATCSRDSCVRILNVKTNSIIHVLNGHDKWVNSAFFSEDGMKIASCASDNTVRIWDLETGKEILKLEGHSSKVICLIWIDNRGLIVSSSEDKTIRIWDAKTGSAKTVLEGHNGSVTNIALSDDGNLLASKSKHSDIRIWRTDTWESIVVLTETSSSYPSDISGLAFNPKFPILASLGEYDCTIRIWEFNINSLLKDTVSSSICYTTAKIVLVGDSGVGKTGLGWRVAHKQFKEHSSTHGQQFWVIDDLGKTRNDGTECEAVLWDLAGQPDYRLVHSLFLDDVTFALILFDPTKRQEPLNGVKFWLKQLKGNNDKLCPCILVGARIDRGDSILLKSELEEFCAIGSINGGYIVTSAKTGEGLPELISKIHSLLPWDNMTATVTTTTFKRIKNYVLSLKENDTETEILLSAKSLRERLKAIDSTWFFSDDEMITAVRHLEIHGYVTILQSSEGELFFLLFPHILTNLASSFVLEARRNPKGLGVLNENKLINCGYDFQELNNLKIEDQKILLDSAISLFLKHNICFREIFNNQTFLVFPSLINEKSPLFCNAETFEGNTYQAYGAVENVYASLVVLLGYTNTFTRTHQWQNKAQYELDKGEICGFKQIDHQDGRIELVLYFAIKAPKNVQLLFQCLFERFLIRKKLKIFRYPVTICGNCGEIFDKNVIKNQIEKGREFCFCNNCGEKTAISKIKDIRAEDSNNFENIDKHKDVAELRTNFETALVRVKALIREQNVGKKSTTCFISYAWGNTTHERKTLQIAKDLRNAGFDVLIDRWHNPPGTSLTKFTDKILSCDYVIVIGTPELREKYESQEDDFVVAAELRLINTRLREPNKYRDSVIPLLIDGNPDTSFIPLLKDIVCIKMHDNEPYFVRIFDVIWRLHGLPFDHSILEDLRKSLGATKRFEAKERKTEEYSY